jgi:cytoskeletal protein CcmA (bactofilin family)
MFTGREPSCRFAAKADQKDHDMFTRRNLTAIVAGLLAMGVFAPAQGFNMNKSINVEAGSETGGHSTVNGSISVSNDATVNGGLETVNGTIRVDDNARIEDAQTVNGSVRIGSGVTARDLTSVNGSISVGENSAIDGKVNVVNGKIGLGRGSSASDDVSNVNGEIDIDGARIGGDLTTVNGDVTLSNGAALQGDLVVEKPQGGRWNVGSRKPRVIIGPGVRVTGEIRLEREVELYISDSAQVGGVSGVMSMDDAERFSGDRP